MIPNCTISVAVSVIFLIALVLFLVIYVRDKELDHERPVGDNNWIVGFLVILVIGFVVSSIVAYRSYIGTARIGDVTIFSNKKRACI